MAEVYKVIHPSNYFNDYISRKVRPDGRSFEDFRDVKVTVNSVKTADASAVVKVGNTTVVCGIKLELTKPKAEEPNVGFLVTNIEVPALCSSKIRPGPPSDLAQITSNLLSDMIRNSKCLDLKDLCIIPDKLAWVLYCDIMCFNNDGSLLDACMTALMASLKTLTLPTITFNEETEDISVHERSRMPLIIDGVPVATSFSIYDSTVLLVDPTIHEEEMCGDVGAGMVVCCIGEMLCGMNKVGGKSTLNDENYSLSIDIAKEKATVVEDIINCAINNTN